MLSLLPSRTVPFYFHIMKLLLLLFLFLSSVPCCVIGREEKAPIPSPSKCMTPCGKYDYNYYWCYTDWSHWIKCTPESRAEIQYKTSLVRNDKPDCLGECASKGKSYNWCFINLKEWDFCSRRQGYSTNDNICKDNCVYSKKTRYYHCYSPSGYYEDCSPPPTTKILTDISTRIASKCNKRTKRWNPHFEFDAIFNLYARTYALRQFASAQDGDNPVTTIRTFAAPPIAGLADVTLLASMTAIIYPHHLALNRPRPQIPAEIADRMTAMQARPGDEQGHLLGSSLGGPNVWYNFVPQTSALNREFHPPNRYAALLPQYWFRIENFIRRYLQDNTAGRVDWAVVVIYNNLAINRRPVGFILNATMYDDNGHLDEYNSFHSLFFSNEDEDPVACELEVAPQRKRKSIRNVV